MEQRPDADAGGPVDESADVVDVGDRASAWLR
jgi:hypothetical protein